MDLKEVWESEEYKQIREEVQDRLCFICIAGSRAYGTNTPTSDIDIRGVMLPTKEELIGLKRFEQKEDSNSDSVFYEFNKFVKLVSECNPNTIELLNSPQIIIFNEVGKALIDNAKMFLSKKAVNRFGGYAQAQLKRLENALSHDSQSEEERIKHLKVSIDMMVDKLHQEDNISIINKNNSLYVNANIDNWTLDKTRATLNDILQIEKVYNELGRRNTKKDLPHLQKHIMHLIRLYLMVFDILEKGEINTYRKNDKDFLLDIRNGKKFLIEGKLQDDFYPYLKTLEDRLEKDKELNIVPNKPDYDKIQSFIMDINSKVINDTVIKYKIPLFIKEN